MVQNTVDVICIITVDIKNEKNVKEIHNYLQYNGSALIMRQYLYDCFLVAWYNQYDCFMVA